MLTPEMNGSGDMTGAAAIPSNPFKIPAHNDVFKLREEERRLAHSKRQKERRKLVHEKHTKTTRINHQTARTRRVVLLCDSLEHFGDTQMTLDQCEASRFSGATEGKDDTQSSKSSKEKYTGRPLKKKKQKQKQPANQRRGKKAFVAVVAAGEGHSSANETTVGGDSGGGSGGGGGVDVREGGGRV